MTRLASKRKLWFTISLLVIVPGFISLIFSGLKLGIDFTGGTLWEVRFSQPATALDIETDAPQRRCGERCRPTLGTGHR